MTNAGLEKAKVSRHVKSAAGGSGFMSSLFGGPSGHRSSRAAPQQSSKQAQQSQVQSSSNHWGSSTSTTPNKSTKRRSDVLFSPQLIPFGTTGGYDQRYSDTSPTGTSDPISMNRCEAVKGVESSDDECGFALEDESPVTMSSMIKSTVHTTITPMDRLHYLIERQHFSGDYSLNIDLINCINLCFGTNKDANNILDQMKELAQRLGVTESFIATVMAIAGFEESELKAEYGTWQMVVEKAKDWGNGQGDLELAKKEVIQILTA